MKDEKRRAELRTQVAEQVAVVEGLQGQVTSPYLQSQLKLAKHFFEDVESVFLRQGDERSPEAEARWIDYAEAPLQFAAPIVKSVQLAVATFGPNAHASSDPTPARTA